MGLDISAYEHVVLVEDEHEHEDAEGNVCYEDEEYGGQGHIPVYNEPSFSHSLGSIQVGRCYVAFGQEFHFRAGSYSGYNEWRAALSNAVLGVTPGRVWRNPDQWDTREFYELINFSDCEGVFGPEVADRLARDFQKHRKTVRAKLAADIPWMAKNYDDFQRAFELASGDGLVQFH